MYRYLSNIVLFLFVFSLPFYTWGSLNLLGVVSVPQLLAMIFFGLSIFDIRNRLSLTDTSKFIYPLFLVLIWMSISTIVNYYRSPSEIHLVSQSGSNDKFLLNLSFLQYVLLLLILLNHLKSSQKLIYASLLIYVSGVLLLSILFSFGIGIEIIGNRFTFFGDNANNTAIRATFGCIIVVGFVLNPQIKNKLKYLLLAAIPQLLIIIGKTASRGALLALAISLFVMIFLIKTTIWHKILIFIVFLSLITPLVVYMERFPLLLERVRQIDSIDSIDRIPIWTGFLKYSFNHPLIGNGVNGYIDMSYTLFGRVSSPHNWFLYVFMVGGLIGLCAYILFFFRVFSNAIRANTVESNLIPLSLLIVVILHISKSGNELTDGSVWFILSVIIAFGINAKNTQNRDTEIKYLIYKTNENSLCN